MTSILILQHQRPDGEVDTYHLKAGRRYHLGRGSQCQVRVLDLKLSRQHCAFEHGDQGWLLVDLASTNGCAIDGERVNGSRPLRGGAVLSAGNTTVTVGSIIDSTAAAAAVPPSERLAAAIERSAHASDDHEPEPSPIRTSLSDALIPSRATTAPEPASPVVPGPDHDVLATMPPNAPAPAPSSEENGSRTFYINVLGRRVGPLTKVQARELKTKELKGTLTPGDLAAVEAEAALGPAPAGAGDEQRTYYVTLLGRRVGPLSRTQARELKSKELRGALTADEVERLVIR